MNYVFCFSEPYTCTGQFSVDFTELCRRNNMYYIPPVVPRPKPPVPQTQQEASPVKAGKDKGKQSASQPEPEPEETTEDGGELHPLVVHVCITYIFIDSSIPL